MYVINNEEVFQQVWDLVKQVFPARWSRHTVASSHRCREWMHNRAMAENKFLRLGDYVGPYSPYLTHPSAPRRFARLWGRFMAVLPQPLPGRYRSLFGAWIWPLARDECLFGHPSPIADVGVLFPALPHRAGAATTCPPPPLLQYVARSGPPIIIRGMMMEIWREDDEGVGFLCRIIVHYIRKGQKLRS